MGQKVQIDTGIDDHPVVLDDYYIRLSATAKEVGACLPEFHSHD